VNTVAPTVKKLKTEVLSDSFHVMDWDAIGLGLRYRVDILINQRRLLKGGGPEDTSEFLQSKYADQAIAKHAENVNTQERLARFIMQHLPNYVAWRLARAVELKLERPKESLADYTDRIYVEDVMILLGHQADLSAAVRVHNSDVIRRFVTDGLRLMPGINSTSTSQEVWSCFEPS
jgi:hypothetical protein